MQPLGHWTASQASVILSVLYISYLAVAIPGGWVIDRFGYRRFVTSSLAITTAGVADTSYAHGYGGRAYLTTETPTTCSAQRSCFS
jgi:fucose permease